MVALTVTLIVITTLMQKLPVIKANLSLTRVWPIRIWGTNFWSSCCFEQSSGGCLLCLTNDEWPILMAPIEGAGLNDGLSQKRWTSVDNRDFTVCFIRCVYRAELILGREFTYRIRIPVLQYQFIKVRLRYINVTRAPWNLREFTRFSCQLQVSSARASYFLDAETCEFPSLSMLPV